MLHSSFRWRCACMDTLLTHFILFLFFCCGMLCRDSTREGSDGGGGQHILTSPHLSLSPRSRRGGAQHLQIHQWIQRHHCRSSLRLRHPDCLHDGVNPRGPHATRPHNERPDCIPSLPSPAPLGDAHEGALQASFDLLPEAQETELESHLPGSRRSPTTQPDEAAGERGIWLWRHAQPGFGHHWEG